MAASYREYPPCPLLREHVSCYWTLSGPGGAAGHRVLPDGCMDLLFDLAVASPGAVIGPMSRALVTAPSGPLDLLGVRFLPGEAFALLGMAAHEARDRTFAIGDLWRQGARALEEQLAGARGTPARLAVLDRALGARRLRARPADPRVRAAVRAVMHASGGVRVDGLSAHTGLGERQLERAFDERVGLGPKAFARVMRLQSLVSAIGRLSRATPAGRRGPRLPWAALAASFGFSDQAHLVREFGRLAGTSPAAYVREQGMSDSFNPPAEGAPTLRSTHPERF